MVHLFGNGAVDAGAYSLPLLRVPAGGKVDAILVSDHRAILATHWIGGRSVLCCSDCGFCGGCDVSSARGLGYFLCAIRSGSGLGVALAECSVTALMALEQTCGQKWIGQGLEISRPARKRSLHFSKRDQHVIYPGGYDQRWRLYGAIASLYRLPLPGRDEPLAAWVARTEDARKLRMAETLKKIGS